MPDYISREALTNSLDELCDRVCLYSKKNRAVMCGACPLGHAFDLVEDIPAANVREVVLCRDCIHLNREKENMSGFYRCDRYDAWQDENDRVHMPLDGFCSYGDRGAEMKGEADGT